LIPCFIEKKNINNNNDNVGFSYPDTGIYFNNLRASFLVTILYCNFLSSLNKMNILTKIMQSQIFGCLRKFFFFFWEIGVCSNSLVIYRQDINYVYFSDTADIYVLPTYLGLLMLLLMCYCQ